MDNNHSWLDQYIESVNAALGAMDIGAMQPFDWLQFSPLISEEWIKKIEEFIERAQQQNLSPADLAPLWATMSGLRCQMYFLMLDFKCTRMPKHKRLEMIPFFFEKLKAGATEDIFGFTSNMRKTQKEVEQLESKHFHQGTPQIARQLGRLYNSLYNLGAGYYVDFYLDYAGENEGPYDVSSIFGPGHILVIKHLKGMKPVELWPNADFPVDNMSIYYVYKDVTYKTDLISLHSTYEGDVIHGLKYWLVEADGNVLSAEDISSLEKKSAHASIEQWQRLKALSFEEQKIKAAEIRCFGMRKLFEKVGMDWRPSQKMLDALKGKPFKDNNYWKIPEQNKKEFWKKMYDPREEFYPGDQLDLTE